MAHHDCVHESDVLTMVTTGQWPDRAPAGLRAHAATCDVCADLALIAQAIDEEHTAPAPALPSAGTVWWRAQIRARQDAAKEVVRPITVAQAIGLAVAMGVAGAVFGASAGWFQRVLQRVGGLLSDAFAAVPRPSWPALPAVDLATLANHTTSIALVGLVLAATAAIVVWAFREEQD
jgi:hypothetical protein